MRKFCAAISVAIVGLLWGGCRQGQFAPKTILFAPPASMTPTILASPSSISVIPTTTPSRPADVAPTASYPAEPFSSPTAEPTPTQAPPLRFSAVAKPTWAGSRLATPTPWPTILPMPALRFTSIAAEPLPCDSRPDAVWRTWQGRDGVRPVRPRLTLLPDQGILWVGAASGVFQVNSQLGVVTRSLTLDKATGVNQTFPANQIFPLGEGRLWVSAKSSNYYFDGQGWATIPISGTTRLLKVVTIDANGDLWACSPPTDGTKLCGDIYRFAGHTPPANNDWWIATPETSHPTWGGCETSESPYYHTAEECQAREKARQIARVKVPNEASMPLGTGMVELDSDGSIWWIFAYVGDDDDPKWILANINGDEIIKLQLPVYWVDAAIPDPHHGIWLATDRGWLYSNGQDARVGLTELDVCSGPDYIAKLEVDTAGTTWVLGRVGTVYALAPGAIEWRQVADPFRSTAAPDAYIISIAAAADGGIWATHGDDLFRLGGSDVIPPIQLPGDCGLKKLKAAGGSIWGLGAECGLLRFDVTQTMWTLYPPIWSIYGGEASPGDGDVDVTADNTVYLLWGGVLYMHSGTFPPDVSSDSGSQWIRVAAVDAQKLAADQANGVWLASIYEGRLWYYKDSHLTMFDAPFGQHLLDDLTVDGQDRPYFLDNLLVDSQNRLWLSLFGGPSMIGDGHSFRQFATPFHSTQILAIAPDNRVWIDGDGNLAVYDPTKDQQP